MNSTIHSLGQKPLRGWKDWVVAVAAALAVALLSGWVGDLLIPRPPRAMVQPTEWVLASLAVTVSGFLLYFTLRWLAHPKRLRALLFAKACVLTLLGLAFVIENWRGYLAWRRAQVLAAEHGLALDLQSHVPPPIPDAENLAMAPLFQPVIAAMTQPPSEPLPENLFQGLLDLDLVAGFFPRRPSLGDWWNGERLPVAEWADYYLTNELPPRVQAWLRRHGVESPEQWQAALRQRNLKPAEIVAEVLRAYDDTLAALAEAARRPRCRFPIAYERGFDARLHHLIHFHRLFDLICFRANIHLQLGRADSALHELQLGFRLVRALEEEPILISLLVSQSGCRNLLQPVWEGTLNRRWNSAQLAALEKELAQIRFLDDLPRVSRAECAWALQTMDEIRSGRVPLKAVLGEPARPDWPRWPRWLPTGWVDQNKANLVRYYIEVVIPAIEAAQKVVPAEQPGMQPEKLATLQSWPKRQVSPYTFLTTALAARFSPSTTLATQTAVDLARVACRIEIHSLRTGRLPESLEELTPDGPLPPDRMTGKPLRYRKVSETAYQLYATGKDGQDDGGLRPPRPPELGRSTHRAAPDWIWRAPED